MTRMHANELAPTAEATNNRESIRHAGTSRIRRHVGPAILAAGALIGADVASAATCESLMTLSLPDTTITSAVSIPGPAFTAPDGKTYSGLPPFCQVTATLTPTTDSLIDIWVWMPASNWSGRFVGTGNGGYAGTIAVAIPAMIASLQAGSVVTSTDMGTVPSSNNDADALAGHPQKWIDFGHRSTHLMTVIAKQIATAFYGQGPRYAYFTGCSTGGQQAMMEAQRYPEDYDGIVAGDPAANRTHVHSSLVWLFQATHATPTSYFTSNDVNLITSSVVAACAVKSSGLASDPFLTDPRACDWTPASIACTSPLQTNCLNTDQVRAASLIYDGTRNPGNGHLIFPGAVKGGENASELGWVALESTPEPQFDSLFKWVFGPTWLWPTYDFDQDMASVDALLAPILNANSADLGAFESRGGKLVMFHGWADPIIAPQDSINYYNRLTATQGGNYRHALKETQKFARLFMVPGMWHCSGGPGPNAFGNLVSAHVTAPPPPVADAAHDVLVALQQWVEHGVAPEQIVATKYVSDEPELGIQMTRPLCPFPKIPRYGGAGDTSDAANFVCVDSTSTNNPVPAPEYLQ